MPRPNNSLIKPVGEQISRRRSNNSAQVFRFPEDLGAHCIVMNFKNYQYGGGNQATQVNNDSIVLPLPANIKDSYQIQVGGTELGLSGAAAAATADTLQGGLDATVTAATESGKSIAEALSGAGSIFQTFENAVGTGTDALKFLARAGLTSVAPQVATGLDVASGATINPHVAVAFNGVGLKTHEFNWSLSPKNAREAEKLKNIVERLRYFSLPEYNSPKGLDTTLTSRALLAYPHMVDIFFLGVDQDYFFYFKTCMISAINIDYTPTGIALNRGGRPSFVNLSLSLIETEIHTKDDYKSF